MNSKHTQVTLVEYNPQWAIIFKKEANEFAHDRITYTNAKSSFITFIDEKAKKLHK